MSKKCRKCGKKLLEKKHSNSKFCNSVCRGAYNKQKEGRGPCYPGLSSTKVGSINELLVSVDLMKKGYDVYGALCFNSKCDLVAIREGLVLRVEVKTGWQDGFGKLFHPKVRKSKRGNFDIKAVFVKNKREIAYVPDLPS